MPELVLLGLQVAGVFVVRGLLQRHSLAETETIPLEAYHLSGIVRQRPDRLEAEVEKDLRAYTIVTQVRLEAEALVGFDRIRAAVLELVGLELVEQSDPAAFLVEVHDNAATIGLDHPHCGIELPAAVAPQRVEHVAGETLRVHADED